MKPEAKGLAQGHLAQSDSQDWTRSLSWPVLLRSSSYELPPTNRHQLRRGALPAVCTHAHAHARLSRLKLSSHCPSQAAPVLGCWHSSLWFWSVWSNSWLPAGLRAGLSATGLRGKPGVPDCGPAWLPLVNKAGGGGGYLSCKQSGQSTSGNICLRGSSAAGVATTGSQGTGM